jgi:hypothetical protein
VHDELQQTPSVQKPLAQAEADVHVCATAGLQMPVASHALVPVHESGSGAFVTDVHVPGSFAPLHVWHVPHAAVSQQVPSTQFPDPQSAPVEHVPPPR